MSNKIENSPALLTVKEKVYDTGLHVWTHGQIVDWHPNRVAARWLLGPCPRCGSVTSNYGGGMNCHGNYCHNSANIFACSADDEPAWWQTNVNVKKDGDMWCAYFDGFINLQESRAEFAATPQKAVDLLLGTKPHTE